MLIAYDHYTAVPASVWRWPHFTPQEMACKGDGSLKLDDAFLDRLEHLRQDCGFALVVSSGYRSPAHNAAVSHTGETGPHTTGHAVDLLVRGAAALTVVHAALGLGFTGVGVSQTGDARFIHLDDLPPDAAPRPMIWSY